MANVRIDLGGGSKNDITDTFLESDMDAITAARNFFTSHDALVAIISALMGAVVGAMTAQIITNRNEKKRIARIYHAWLKALDAELDYTFQVIDEAVKELSDSRGFTKRMNADLFQSARLALFEYREEVVFFKSLTITYRDIVHTNGIRMLRSN